jgi:hypothetical protein
VYHDAVLVSYGFRDQQSLLRGILFGGVPEMPIVPTADTEELQPLITAMAKLNKRVGLLQMTDHVFLDSDRKKEKTTFADGTTIVVDWVKNTFSISPELN